MKIDIKNVRSSFGLYTQLFYLMFNWISIAKTMSQLFYENDLSFSHPKKYLLWRLYQNDRFDLTTYSLQRKVILDPLQVVTRRFPRIVTVARDGPPFPMRKLNKKHRVANTISPHLKSPDGPRDCINSLDRIRDAGCI